MTKRPNVIIGIVKCPNTSKLYGVRIEIKDNKDWIATWAFPIKPEVAKREGYVANQFPPGLQYDQDYPGCPYCKKKEDLVKITAPEVKKEPCIMVGTNSNYDDLGRVLSSMNIKWKPLGNLKDCDVLFLNCCGSAPDESELRNFVKNGGCVFASCTQSRILESTFPDSLEFTDIGFESGTETVTIEDAELRSIVGNSMKIHFHTAGSGNPSGGNFKTIMRGCGKLFEYGTNICVRATHGKGAIFFTMFHNSDNINEQEKALLQLLVLKELGNSQNRNLAEAGAEFGVDIEKIKAKFRSNW
jgi:hypothetical protein